MNQKTKKKATYWLGVIIVGIALGLALQFVRAWTEPPAGGPPTGDLGAPINTGNIDQTKSGGLGVRGGFVTGTNTFLARLGGNVGIGTTNPAQKFHVVGGKAQADDFCLNSDPVNKCISKGLVIQGVYSDCLCNSGTPSCGSGYTQAGGWTGSCCPGDWCGPVLQCVLCVKYL